MKSLGNDGVLEEHIKGYDLQGVLMCRLKNYGTCGACLLHLQPSRRANTPAVARLQAGESILWHGSGKIIAEMSGDGEKLLGHNTADGVHAEIVGAGVAAAVTIETSLWLGAAGFQGLTQYILLD